MHKDNHLYFVMSARKMELRCNAQWHRTPKVWSIADRAYRALLGDQARVLFGESREDIQRLLASCRAPRRSRAAHPPHQ